MTTLPPPKSKSSDPSKQIFSKTFDSHNFGRGWVHAMILLIFSEENEVLDLHEESILNYFNKLKSTCQKNSNRLTVAEVNTNSLQKKIGSFARMTND